MISKNYKVLLCALIMAGIAVPAFAMEKQARRMQEIRLETMQAFERYMEAQDRGEDVGFVPTAHEQGNKYSFCRCGKWHPTPQVVRLGDAGQVNMPELHVHQTEEWLGGRWAIAPAEAPAEVE